MVALEVVFWVCAALIVWTQVGYALVVAVLARLIAPAPEASVERDARTGIPPSSKVSLIVAAHDEQDVIGAKIQNALELDYPRDLLEVIVVCDGCADETARRAREAGADIVLELPRGGKIVAQDAAVERAGGEIVAFSDANAAWEAGRFAQARRGFCGSASGLCVRARSLRAGSRCARRAEREVSSPGHQPGGRLLAL